MLGIDIIDISRIEKMPDKFFLRFFSGREIAEAKAGSFYEKMAGKWAVKEAAYKAGIKCSYKKIEVLSRNKKPVIFVNNQRKKYQVSISHEKQYAIAIVARH